MDVAQPGEPERRAVEEVVCFLAFVHVDDHRRHGHHHGGWLVAVAFEKPVRRLERSVEFGAFARAEEREARADAFGRHLYYVMFSRREKCTGASFPHTLRIHEVNIKMQVGQYKIIDDHRLGGEIEADLYGVRLKLNGVRINFKRSQSLVW